jgi:hypothetical protein
MMIIRSSGAALDWERVVNRVQGRRMTVTVGQALSWLREHLDAPIPGWVLEQLSAGPRLVFERAVHAIYSRPFTPLTFAVMSFDRYRRFTKLAPPADRPTSFAAYLKDSWQLDNSLQLAAHGGRKLAGRRR